MANLSFTSSGSTPYKIPSPGMGTQTSTPATSNPIASALNAARQPMVTPPPSIPAPSTPVKSTTVNNPDGTSHVTTYHAPAPNPSTETKPTTVTDSSAAPTTPQSSTPTFQGLLGNLANTSSKGSKTAPGYIQNTSDYGAGNIRIGKQAQQIADEYGRQIADVGGAGARYMAGQRTTGTSPVAEGNAAVTAQTTAAQQQALAQGESAALQGIGYQLTGQNQAANAANMAAGQSLTGQGLEQSGLNQAGTLAQPQLGAIGQVPYNPAEGSQGDVLGSTQQGGLQAAGQLLGQFQGAQAAGAAPGQTQASNIQTGGTAVTGANATGLAQSIQSETALQTAATNAQALAAQVAETLNNVGLTNSTDANTAINNLQSRLGNAAFTQLNIAVNDARNAYQAILTATGATPTDAGAAANQNINANMSPNQIKAAIDQLNQGIKARQDAAHQQTTQYQNQLKGSGGSTGGTIVQTSAGAVNTNW